MNVSVVIPLYNKTRYISRALETIYRQTLQPLEVLVVDDGSTDDSVAVVQRHARPEVRVISQRNSGPGIARHRGCLEAQGDCIALLDADDEWHAEFLARAVRLLEDFPQAGVAGMRYAIINQQLREKPVHVHGLKTQTWRGLLPDFFRASFGYPPLHPSSTVIRSSVFTDSSITPSPALLGEDQHLWCQLAVRHPIAYDSTVSAFYRTEAEGRSCVTHPITGELPFVTLMKELLDANNLGIANPDSVRQYIIDKQLLTARTVLRRQRDGALARRLLDDCPLLSKRCGIRMNLWLKSWLV